MRASDLASRIRTRAARGKGTIPSRIQKYNDVRFRRILDPRGSCDCTAEDLPSARLSVWIRAARYKSSLRAPREACFLPSAPPFLPIMLIRSSDHSPRTSPVSPPRCFLVVGCAHSRLIARPHSRACELSANIAGRQASPDTSTIATHLNQTRLHGLLRDRWPDLLPK